MHNHSIQLDEFSQSEHSVESAPTWRKTTPTGKANLKQKVGEFRGEGWRNRQGHAAVGFGTRGGRRVWNIETDIAWPLPL